MMNQEKKSESYSGKKGLLWNWIIFLLIFKMRLFQLKIAGFINIKGIPSKGLPVRLLEN